MNKREENRFVRRLKARDPRAFEQLIQEHQTRIYNLIFRMIGNREEAEDLLQEVFITVFKKIGNFRGDSSLSTWVYKIATNLCINRKKYFKRRHHYTQKSYADMTEQEQAQAGQIVASTIPRPDEMAEGHQMEKAIQKSISQLDEEYRMVLVLRDIQHLSYDEIEDILQVPEGTVKSRLHRARMMLKDKLMHNMR